MLKPAELRKLQMDFTEERTAKAIEDLSCKLADGTQQSENHYATLTYWLSYRQNTGTQKGKLEAAEDTMRETEKILGL